MTDFIKENGIKHQTSCLGTPQQNRVSERKNKHLLNIARSIMMQIYVSCKYWLDAVTCVCHIINRTPSKKLSEKRPLEIIQNKRAGINHLRIFWCTCFMHI